MKLINAHYRSIITSITRILNKPFEHMLNILVISIIIAILSSIFVITKSSRIWETSNINYPQIMIYLSQNAKQSDVSKLEVSISKFNQKLIRNYQFISKQQGLQELQQDQQLQMISSDVITESSNPLPDVLIVNTNTANPKLLSQLIERIGNMNMVDNVQMDTNYANKINDLINFIKYIATFLQIVFVIVFILVVYNMIRLQMLLRQDEIIVSRLIGASDSFIMRPLAYYAILQVTLASLLAYFLVNWFINFMNGLFSNLKYLFGNSFLLTNLTSLQLGQMLVILIIFTIFSVFLAVQWVFKHAHA
ncbi:MAG: cell division transport system permease protein [Pseudomonadota bacterium]|nr:cell division transport system permease protein [Pseudomonadota bacterium]